MIDIHSHILPCVDDGSQSLEESLAMARAAVDDGIRQIIATPHHANGRYDNPAEGVVKSVGSLNEELRREGIELEVLAGQEIRVYGNLVDDWLGQLLLPLHRSSYLLIELPTGDVPKHMPDLIHELQVMQLIPIIAHPERNQVLLNNPKRLQELVELGALGQVTSHSLNGAFGKKIQEVSLHMCKSNLIHFVASDAHNLTSRSFGLTSAYHVIEEKVGKETASYFKRNAQAVVEGSRIEARQLVKAPKKRFFFW